MFAITRKNLKTKDEHLYSLAPIFKIVLIESITKKHHFIDAVIIDILNTLIVNRPPSEHLRSVTRHFE
ncbi:hypothetical protein NIES2100_25150 [Calothrix sp. NIES-2100]|nr:hypothetical protein NIES2100_25150 [Calothrix sp. NIES-2100]